MKELTNSQVFGMLLSLVAFEIGCFAYRKSKSQLFNPLFVAITITIIVLISFNISLDNYNKGAQFISFFLGPATVILAVPLYKNIDLIKKHWLPILAGTIFGSLIAMVSIVSLSYLFHIERIIKLSLISKSVTAPIGMEVSKQLGGIPEISMAAIVITGIMGAMFAPVILKIFKIKDKVAQGIAIGTAAHAVGTTKAIEMGDTEGAMSSLAIGLAGLATVLLAPMITILFKVFLK